MLDIVFNLQNNTSVFISLGFENLHLQNNSDGVRLI